MSKVIPRINLDRHILINISKCNIFRFKRIKITVDTNIEIIFKTVYCILLTAMWDICTQFSVCSYAILVTIIWLTMR